VVSRNLWHSCGQHTLETLFAGFALHRWLDSPRIVRKVDYGPRWRGHYVDIQARTDLDDELRGWLQEAHDVVGCKPVWRTEPAAGHGPARATESCLWLGGIGDPLVQDRCSDQIGKAQGELPIRGKQ